MDKGFVTPSRVNRRNGPRGCMCKDKPIYHPDCCDGSIWAQGVGTSSITATILTNGAGKPLSNEDKYDTLLTS